MRNSLTSLDLSPENCPPALLRRRILGPDGPLGNKTQLPFRLTLPVASLGTGSQAIDLVAWREPDGVPRVVGVHLQAIKPQVPAPGGGVLPAIRLRMVAHLIWGHDGALFEADVDMLAGTSFSLFCDTLRITARNDSDPIVFDPVPQGGVPMTAIGLINPEGPLASRSILRRSFDFTGSAGDIFPIPPFATELDLIRTDNTTAYTINFRRNNGAIVGAVAVAANTDFLRRSIPIPQDASDVQIVAVGALECELIFYLAI